MSLVPEGPVIRASVEFLLSLRSCQARVGAVLEIFRLFSFSTRPHLSTLLQSAWGWGVGRSKEGSRSDVLGSEGGHQATPHRGQEVKGCKTTDELHGSPPSAGEKGDFLFGSGSFVHIYVYYMCLYM